MQVWRYQVKHKGYWIYDVIIPDFIIPQLRKEFGKVKIEEVLSSYAGHKLKGEGYDPRFMEVTLDTIYSVESLDQKFNKEDRGAFIFTKPLTK